MLEKIVEAEQGKGERERKSSSSSSKSRIEERQDFGQPPPANSIIRRVAHSKKRKGLQTSLRPSAAALVVTC